MRETIGPLPAWNWWLVERDRQVQIITYIKYFQQVIRALKKIKQESDRVTEGPGATLEEAINLPTRSGKSLRERGLELSPATEGPAMRLSRGETSREMHGRGRILRQAHAWHFQGTARKPK